MNMEAAGSEKKKPVESTDAARNYETEALALVPGIRALQKKHADAIAVLRSTGIRTEAPFVNRLWHRHISPEGRAHREAGRRVRNAAPENWMEKIAAAGARIRGKEAFREGDVEGMKSYAESLKASAAYEGRVAGVLKGKFGIGAEKPDAATATLAQDTKSALRNSYLVEPNFFEWFYENHLKRGAQAVNQSRVAALKVALSPMEVYAAVRLLGQFKGSSVPAWLAGKFPRSYFFVDREADAKSIEQAVNAAIEANKTRSLSRAEIRTARYDKLHTAIARFMRERAARKGNIEAKKPRAGERPQQRPRPPEVAKVTPERREPSPPQAQAPRRDEQAKPPAGQHPGGGGNQPHKPGPGGQGNQGAPKRKDKPRNRNRPPGASPNAAKQGG